MTSTGEDLRQSLRVMFRSVPIVYRVEAPTSEDASSMTPISMTFLRPCARETIDARFVAAKADGREIVRTDATATPAEPCVSQVYRESAGSLRTSF
jgi:hypothetical protein